MSGRAGWLGWDPAPGDPEQLRALGRRVARTAVELGVGADALRRLARADGGWSGTAAEAYRTRLGRLPGRLDDAASALQAASRALAGFADRLDEAQLMARRMADEAEALQARPDDDLAARLRLDQLRRRAALLRDEVRAGAAAVARTLDAAAQAAPDEPGLFERLVTGNVRWVEAASVVLSVAAGVAALSGVGAPAAVVLGLAAASVAATATLYHYGEADEQALVLSAVGAMTVPVGLGARAVAGAAAASGAATSGASAARAAATSSRAAAVARGADAVGWEVTAGSAAGLAAGLQRDAVARHRRHVCATTSTLAPARPQPGPLVDALRPGGTPLAPGRLDAGPLVAELGPPVPRGG